MSRNTLHPFSKLSDHQGCQIQPTGLPDYNLLNISGIKWLRELILGSIPTLSMSRNLSQPSSKLSDHQEYQIQQTGLLDTANRVARFTIYRISFIKSNLETWFWGLSPHFQCQGIYRNHHQNCMTIRNTRYSKQGCQILLTGLPDLRFIAYLW